MNNNETYLNPIAELLYQIQIGNMKSNGDIYPFDNGQDYDFRGAYNAAILNNHNANSHFPDTFKKPNHRTFSNESIYYKKGMPHIKWDNYKVFGNGTPINK